MATKQEKPNEFIDKTDKKLFFENIQIKHRELAKWQRDYKYILGKRYKTRSETIVKKSLCKTIDALQQERNDLRAQIWVANSAQHMRENERYLNEIKCHVDCQEHLSEEISTLKVAIANMEHATKSVQREIYELNLQTVPEPQHQQHVQHVRKSLGMLQNQLEVSIRRESIFGAENRKLREDFKNILNNRAQFNCTYKKLVNDLNSQKKYVTDLVEYAANMCNNCIHVSERTDSRLEKIKEELETRRTVAQTIIRDNAAKQILGDFIDTKGKTRVLAPLLPKEVRRRAECKYAHEKKLKLYNHEIKKLTALTNSLDVLAIIEQYQEQETVYYSYFRLDNEREYHITLLNSSISRLYNEVESQKKGNANRKFKQWTVITKLEEKLEHEQVTNQELHKELDNETNRLNNYLAELQTLMALSKLNYDPLLELLGDHTRLNLVNMRRFMKLFEERIVSLLNHFYVAERTNSTVPADKYVVREIDKIREIPTALGDIVLAQHCPECAEGEAFTADDASVPCHPLSHKETQQLLLEKVQQAEMQYRLHSISQCRLPRSRLLAAKRNN